MQHYAHVEDPAAAAEPGDSGVDITFTATTSATGSLLLGSSRELSWDQEPAPAVTQAILDRARDFLPALGSSTAAEVVRVGLRPQAVRGTPFVGPISGVEGLFIAAGHEGSGLLMAPVTAQIICDHIVDGSSTIRGAETLLPVLESV